MVYTYYRIYVVATRQTKSLKLGAKQIEGTLNDNGDNITLRIHRGGNANASASTCTSHGPTALVQQQQQPIAYNAKQKKYSTDSSDDHHFGDLIDENDSSTGKPGGSIKSNRNANKANWSVGKRLAKLAKEKKAAKTLGK